MVNQGGWTTHVHTHKQREGDRERQSMVDDPTMTIATNRGWELGKKRRSSLSQLPDPYQNPFGLKVFSLCIGLGIHQPEHTHMHTQIHKSPCTYLRVSAELALGINPADNVLPNRVECRNVSVHGVQFRFIVINLVVVVVVVVVVLILVVGSMTKLHRLQTLTHKCAHTKTTTTG